MSLDREAIDKAIAAFQSAVRNKILENGMSKELSYRTVGMLKRRAATKEFLAKERRSNLYLQQDLKLSRDSVQ